MDHGIYGEHWLVSDVGLQLWSERLVVNNTGQDNINRYRYHGMDLITPFVHCFLITPQFVTVRGNLIYAGLISIQSRCTSNSPFFNDGSLNSIIKCIRTLFLARKSYNLRQKLQKFTYANCLSQTQCPTFITSETSYNGV